VFGVFIINKSESESESEDDSESNAKIILLKQKYKSSRFADEIIGQVKNVGNGTAEFVKISFTLFDKKGELIGTEHTFADPHTLKPGQKSTFKNFIDEKTGDKVKAFEVSLTWKNPDGADQYIENVDVEDENNYMIFQQPRKFTEEEIEKLGLFER
jgi:hypothetical protein